MTVYLVRHAAAGDRAKWDGPDWIRPLTDRGRAQARGLLELLDGAQFTRIVSSPYVRCSETMLPLAGARRVAIEIHDSLGEGSDVEGALALLKDVAVDGGVLCSHGDIIPEVLERVAVDLGSHPRVEKGSVWALETQGGTVRSAHYLAPFTH